MGVFFYDRRCFGESPSSNVRSCVIRRPVHRELIVATGHTKSSLTVWGGPWSAAGLAGERVIEAMAAAYGIERQPTWRYFACVCVSY